MPRVICDLPNAADEISGVKFHKLDDGGLISDEIDQAQAERFASIPGYTVADADAEPAKVEVKPAPTTRAKKAAAKTAAEPVAPAAETDNQQAPSEPQPSGEAGEGEEVF